MRKLTKQMVETTVITEIKCDLCGKDIGPTAEDELDAQEAITICFTGGYSSVFGDMETFRADLCQHCLHKGLGDVLRPVEQEEEED